MAINWLSRANKSNYQKRGDYGIRVARPGFDASNCAQNQLIFNSGWPILQIVAVIDMSKHSVGNVIYKKTIVEYYTGTIDGQGVFHPETYETSTTVEKVDSVPSGLPSTDISESPDDFRDYSVNKQFVMKRTGVATLYNGGSTTESGDLPSGKHYVRDTTISYTKREARVARHRLGYTPFFFPSSALLGGNSNYVILFSVDITKDVDYPYTEAPLPFISPVHDYGIKSESIFGKNVPGLCTNMFSKLVQAVKTTETSTYNDGENDIVFWTPLSKDANLSTDGAGSLLPYEFYAFVGDGDKTQEGGQYYSRFAPHYISYATSSDAYIADAYMVGVYGQDTQPNGVLVVLRSPMVSPEYEEF